MERVIVTVKREGEARVRDLEVPAEVSSAHLAELIAHALSWEHDSKGNQVGYVIVATPPGRGLRADECLVDAGVWDGAWLVFRPVAPTQKPNTPAPISGERQPSNNPIVGFKPLILPGATDNTPSEPTQPKQSASKGYVWKQLPD